MTGVKWADVLAVIIVLRSTYVGSQRGFFGELFYIFGVFCTILFSLHFYLDLSTFLNKYLFIPVSFSGLISYSIISVGIYISFVFVYTLLQKIMKIEVFPAINRIGGPVLGFCKGYIVATILFMLMLLTPINYIMESAKTKSLLGPFFIKTGTVLYKKSLSIFPFIESKDLSGLLAGAEPVRFRIFPSEKRDRAEELLE